MKAFATTCLLTSLWSLCLCGESHSGTPRDELLRLAPADAGFCLIVQGWRGQVAQLNQSPVVARLAATPYGQALRGSPEAQKLAALDEQLRTQLKISWAQLRDEVL